VAYLDADLGQKAVGPPTTVSLRVLRTQDDIRSEAMALPDALYFVGSTTPQGQLLPLVVGAGRLLEKSVELGADLVVVDTSGTVGGVYGQLLKYHKLEQLQPDMVIGLQRGEELEPILGIVSRFFSAEVAVLPVEGGASPSLPPGEVGVPVTQNGELLGTISIRMPWARCSRPRVNAWSPTWPPRPVWSCATSG